MNKRQRKNKQRREYRADVTTITADVDTPMRPLHGFEAFYSITANGQLWSNRLKRYVKPTLGLDGKTLHLQFSIRGQIHHLSIWQAVVDSWLDENVRDQVLDKIPEFAVGGSKIEWEQVDIVSVASAFDIPPEFVRHLVAKKHRLMVSGQPA